MQTELVLRASGAISGYNAGGTQHLMYHKSLSPTLVNHPSPLVIASNGTCVNVEEAKTHQEMEVHVRVQASNLKEHYFYSNHISIENALHFCKGLCKPCQVSIDKR